LSHGKATLKELETYYSLEDVYFMLEVISIDNHNRKLAADAAKKSKD